MLSAFLLIGIALFQSLQYLLGAEIPSGTKSIEIAQFINEKILANDPSATIGFVDYAPVAALTPADRKYQRVAVGGYNTFVGQHPLSLPPEKFPTYMLELKKADPYQEILKTFYMPFSKTSHDILIYKKSS